MATVLAFGAHSGTTTTDSIPVPEGAVNFLLDSGMTAEDAGDAGKSARFVFEWNFEDDTWVPILNYDWVGNPTPNRGVFRGPNFSSPVQTHPESGARPVSLRAVMDGRGSVLNTDLKLTTLDN